MQRAFQAGSHKSQQLDTDRFEIRSVAKSKVAIISDLAKAWYHGAAPHYAAWAGFPVVLAYIVLPRII